MRLNQKKWLVLAVAGVILAAFAFSPSAVQAQKDPKTLKFADLEFKAQKPGMAAVKEGVTFYFKEDREQPVINGTVIIKTGSLYEPADRIGLAYSTGGMIGLGRDKGMFYNFCMTKSQSAGEAIKLMKDISADMTKNPVTAEELEVAKKYEVNAFVHKFDSAQAVVSQAVYLKLDGYPDNYLDTYLPRIRNVDEAKVLAIGKRAVHADSMVILVVGKKAEVIDQLKALGMGEITELPLPKE